MNYRIAGTNIIHLSCGCRIDIIKLQKRTKIDYRYDVLTLCNNHLCDGVKLFLNTYLNIDKPENRLNRSHMFGDHTI